MRLQRKKENALHGVVTEFNRVTRVVARRVEKLKRRQLEELKAARAAEPAIPANSKPKKDKKENRHGIERRGKMWRVRLYDRTTGRQRTWTVSTEEKAKEVRSREYHKLALQAIRMKDAQATGVSDVRFSELLERYKKEWVEPTFSPGAVRAYQSSFDVFELYFIKKQGDPLIHTIRKPHVMQFLAWRRAHPLKGTSLAEVTLKRDRSVLHGLFAFAVKMGLLDREGEGSGFNPVARVDKPKAEKRDAVILSDAEYELLLNECGDDDMLRLFVLTMGETAARSESEVLWVKWEHLDFEDGRVPGDAADAVEPQRGWVTFKNERKGHQNKTKKTRSMPMSTRLRRALEAHAKKYEHATYDGVRSPWVFHYAWTRGKRREGERIVSLRNRFKKAARRAGISPEFTQHDLRHRAGTTFYGINPGLAREALGHGSVVMTEKYVHPKREALRALVK